MNEPVPADSGTNYVAESDELPADHKFEYRVSIGREAILEHLDQSPDVAWTGLERPKPFPDASDPPLQAWTRPDGVILIRATTLQDTISSPVVELRVEDQPWGANVAGKFLKRPPRTLKAERTHRNAIYFAGALLLVEIIGLIAAPMIFIGYWYAPFLLIALLIVSSSRNRPTPASMQTHGSTLWGLVGRILVPYQLAGETDDPFRERALEAGAERAPTKSESK